MPRRIPSIRSAGVPRSCAGHCWSPCASPSCWIANGFADSAPTDNLVRTEAHHHLVDVAPAPVFAGLGRADDRVASVLVMGGGVFADRVVAAADVAAGLAHPQVHPLHPLFQALLATGHLVRELEELDRVEVGALSHCRWQSRR